jgi:hypothetical protein
MKKDCAFTSFLFPRREEDTGRGCPGNQGGRCTRQHLVRVKEKIEVMAIESSRSLP